MAIAIQPYTPQWIPAVEAFNRRLAGGGVTREFHFPESDVPAWLPKVPGRRIYQEFHLATDDADIRGAYILKFQDFSIGGRTQPLAYYHLPVSEGIVNRSYSSVGVQMIRTALRAQPLLFCLGMGGFDRPLPQMLKALGWEMTAVPFYFKVVHPARVLRQIGPLRQTAGRRLLAAVAAGTGLGPLGIKAYQAIRAKRRDRSVTAEPVGDFGPWADAVWDHSRAGYDMIGSRDRDTLNVLYAADKPFLRLRVRQRDETIGWAVALDTPMQGNKYFGDLRVGSIVDCCAATDDAAPVIEAATRFLEARGVDVIVSNQSHRAWIAALQRRGFLEGPSNFVFAASKALGALLSPFEEKRTAIHLTRGDGDGPVNL